MSRQVTFEPGGHTLSQHLGLNIHDKMEDCEMLDVFSTESDDQSSREESSCRGSDSGTTFEIEIGDGNEEFDEDEYIQFLLEMGPTDTIRVVEDEFCVVESNKGPYDDEDETDDEDLEYALEEKQYTIDSGDGEKIVVTIETSLSQDEDHLEFYWIETVNARCTLDGRDIGRALGRFIDREAIRKTFWENMDMGSDSTAELAFGIFDRWGYLKSLYKNHPVQKGTGVWNDLDHGMLFLIEDVYVDSSYRRKGLGRVMVSALLEKTKNHATYSGEGPNDVMERIHGEEETQKLSRLHALVIPRATERDTELQFREEMTLAERREVDEQILRCKTSFWRSVGFRRVGASKCFAFSFDPDHLSHKILASEDFDLVHRLVGDYETKDVSVGDSDEMQCSESDARPRRKLPLHSAVVTLDDAECIKLLERFKQNHLPDILIQQDSFGNNPLHVATCQIKPLSLKWILDNITEGQQWKQDRNLGGFTPFEALRELLEIARTRMVDGSMVLNVSDQFEGYTDDAVACLSLVEDEASKMGTLPAFHNMLLRYGCTCGKCLGGFISPRMRLALYRQAEMMSARLALSMRGAGEWCTLHESTISYLAPDVQEALKEDQVLRWLIQRMFLQVAVCLRADVVPGPTTVMTGMCNGQAWTASRQRDVADNIGSVLAAIFSAARAKDVKAGDGTVEEAIGVELAELDSCRNDHEFSFVARACGLCQDIS
ncbi:DNA (cytosine-5)-methyltransferase PliMCI [Talaromyces islandicus]|uniref:DNA (Cytosine-5)-methyltransferase PliMCI n=1 Tax=Talaromyces islandicus TaxID=28573 RepID=A0A0U1LWK1_TALIS|nr:DNA (cytosine-5)-methyltransferase PliMCI [Talaromyces islandicus]